MITLAVAKGLVAKLMLAYPRQELTEGSVNLYAAAIVGLELPVAAQAVDLASATYTYFPNLAELLQAVSRVAIGAPEPEGAWAQAQGDPPRHPLVQRALAEIGGRSAIRMSERPGVLHAQFVRRYQELLREAHDELHLHGNWRHVAALPQPRQPPALGAGDNGRTTEEQEVGLLNSKQYLAQLRGGGGQ